MKLNLFILLTALLFFTSCNKDEPNPGDGISEGNCTISWKLDGTSNSAEPAICIYIDNTLNLGLVGSDNIQMQIQNLTAPGTFDLGSNDAVLLMDNGSGSVNSLGSNMGSIIVTELSSSKAKGTFSGTFYALSDLTMSNPFSVTDGKFTANF